MRTKRAFQGSALAGAALLSCAIDAVALSGASIQHDIAGPTVFNLRDPVKVFHTYSDSGTLFDGRAYSLSVGGSANLEDGLVRGKALSASAGVVEFTNTIFDDLTIFGTAGTTARVGAIFHVDGSGDLDDIGDSNREFQLEARVSARVSGSSVSGTSIYKHKWGLYTLGLGGSEIYERTPTGNVEMISGSKGSFEVELSVWLDVPILAGGFSAPVSAQWILKGHATNGQDAGSGLALIDASNTGRAGFIVPAGYSYTSASGVFLTTPVPEPGTYALFGAGLLLVGWRAMRGRMD